MKIEARCEKGVTELEIDGTLDVESADELERAVGGLLAKGEKFIAFNFHGLRYMDSHGLGKLISTFRMVAAEGGAAVLHSVPDDVMHIFELTRLHLVFEVYSRPGEAHQRLAKLLAKS